MGMQSIPYTSLTLLMRNDDASQSCTCFAAVELLFRGGIGSKWLHAEGASLMGTLTLLRKAWTDEAPSNLVFFVFKVVSECTDPASSEEGGAAAVESASLAVAHLLPVVLRCVTTPVLYPRPA